MGKWNPFSLAYSQEENKTTELLLHVLEETKVTAMFLKEFGIGDGGITDYIVESQWKTKITEADKVDHPFVLCISKSGEVERDEPSGKTTSITDGYLQSDISRIGVLLELKIYGNPLVRDQIERHKKLFAAFDHAEVKVISISWQEVITFFQRMSTDDKVSEKNRYIFLNFFDFLVQEGYSESFNIQTVFNKGTQYGKAPRLIHEMMLQRFDWEPNSGAPLTIEYTWEDTRIAALDVKRGRFIFKFGRSKRKQEMIEMVLSKFPQLYVGTYDNLSTEVCIRLQDCVDENQKPRLGAVDDIKHLVDYSHAIRNKST